MKSINVWSFIIDILIGMSFEVTVILICWYLKMWSFYRDFFFCREHLKLSKSVSPEPAISMSGILLDLTL